MGGGGGGAARGACIQLEHMLHLMEGSMFDCIDIALTKEHSR